MSMCRYCETPSHRRVCDDCIRERRLSVDKAHLYELMRERGDRYAANGVVKDSVNYYNLLRFKNPPPPSAEFQVEKRLREKNARRRDGERKLGALVKKIHEHLVGRGFQA